MSQAPKDARQPIEADYNLPEEEGSELPSKSQRKREMHALQDMGEELVQLPAAKLDKLPLPDRLRDAIDLCQQISAHEGKRRQLQFIGKLLRDVEVEPLQQALAQLQQHAKIANQRFHQLERWRDRLIAEGDDALNAFLAEYPGADRQSLRQLIRTAQKEAEQGKPPAASRELFKTLRAQVGE